MFRITIAIVSMKNKISRSENYNASKNYFNNVTNNNITLIFEN